MWRRTIALALMIKTLAWTVHEHFSEPAGRRLAGHINRAASHW